MKNKARQMAHHILLKYGLSAPTLDDIVSIISQQGFDIIDYDPSSASVQELTQTLSLNSQILAQNAFLYTNHDVKLLFIRDSLDAEETRIASAHELGHPRVPGACQDLLEDTDRQHGADEGGGAARRGLFVPRSC